MPYPSHARVACTHDTPDTALSLHPSRVADKGRRDGRGWGNGRGRVTFRPSRAARVAVLWLLLSGLTSVLNLPLTSDDRAKCFLRPESERVFSFSWLGTGSPGLGRRGDRVTGVVDELGEGRANNALPSHARVACTHDTPDTAFTHPC